MGGKQKRAQDELKFETARELGLDDDLLAGGDELTVREAGKIGGQMVRKLVKRGEDALEGATETTADTAEQAADTARNAADITVDATERARKAAGKGMEAVGEEWQK